MTDHVTPEPWREGLSASANPGKMAPDDVTPPAPAFIYTEEEKRSWMAERDSLAAQVEALQGDAGQLADEVKRLAELVEQMRPVVEAAGTLHNAAARLDQALTEAIGTDEYPNALTSLHTELRLAAWKSGAALDASRSEPRRLKNDTRGGTSR